MLKGFILGCFLCIPIISFAESNWKVVGSSKENVYGIDINSISNGTEYPYQSNKKAWIKSVIVNDLTKDSMTVGDYNMVLQWANCNARTLGYKSNTAYRKNGTVINNLSNSVSYVRMSDVIPGSIGEAILDSICSPE